MGQFTQEDPIGIAGGLNLYGYANGDPINFSDPFGLCAGGAAGDTIKVNVQVDCPQGRRTEVVDAVVIDDPAAIADFMATYAAAYSTGGSGDAATFASMDQGVVSAATGGKLLSFPATNSQGYPVASAGLGGWSSGTPVIGLRADVWAAVRQRNASASFGRDLSGRAIRTCQAIGHEGLHVGAPSMGHNAIFRFIGRVGC